MTGPAFDHARPPAPGDRVERSPLAKFLGVPELYAPDGRLTRVVCVWRGTLGALMEALDLAGMEPGPALAYPGLDGPGRALDGVLFYPLGPIVLCAAYEDILETIVTPGRLGWLLSKTAGQGTMAVCPPRRPALPPPLDHTEAR